MLGPRPPVPEPPHRRLLLAGGGHSHALVLRRWAMHPQLRPRGADITLVSRSGAALYSGMVPGLVAGIHDRRDCTIDLRLLCRQAGVRFIQAEIVGLDLQGRQLRLRGRPPLGYEVLSLDVGAVTDRGRPELTGEPAGAPPASQPAEDPHRAAGEARPHGAAEGAQPSGAMAVKPLEPFLAWCAGLAPGRCVRLRGGGAAAVELALALRSRGLACVLLLRGDDLHLGSATANRAGERLLRRAGIAIERRVPPEAPADLWCTGSRAPAWLATAGLPVDPASGRVLAERDLRVCGQDALFVSGDCGLTVSDPRPASGVWAVRAAPFLAENLRRVFQTPARPLVRWRPQRLALQLLADGSRRWPAGSAGAGVHVEALALWGPFALGPAAWLGAWKDRIDRGFMARLGAVPGSADAAARSNVAASDPGAGAFCPSAPEDAAPPLSPGTPPGRSDPAGATPAAPDRHAPLATATPAGRGGPGRIDPQAAPMACRGCAAKLAAAPLAAALARLDPERPPSPPEDAVPVTRTAEGSLLLQSVDGFPAVVEDPWLNARLTALHACSDLWACGVRVESVQALVTVPQAAPRLQEEMLFQSLSGLRSVLDPLGARLLGGHTLEGRDGAGLSMALTVQGPVVVGDPWPKGPLRPGDALLLSRPLGSGVLMAAAMVGAADPTDLDGLLQGLQVSQAGLVALLAAHGCHACTDITGFGLLGHLGEMVAAGPGVRVTLAPEAIPAWPGALALLAQGYASTLAPANAGALTLLGGAIRLGGAPGAAAPAPRPGSLEAARRALLLDPQTCGPLLAALPGERAAAALAALQQAGFRQAAVIGTVSG